MDTNYKNMAGVILLFIRLNQMFQVCQPLIRDERKVSIREKKIRHPVICSSHIYLPMRPLCLSPQDNFLIFKHLSCRRVWSLGSSCELYEKSEWFMDLAFTINCSKLFVAEHTFCMSPDFGSFTMPSASADVLQITFSIILELMYWKTCLVKCLWIQNH